jgi:hypothetical protein
MLTLVNECTESNQITQKKQIKNLQNVVHESGFARAKKSCEDRTACAIVLGEDGILIIAPLLCTLAKLH